MPSAKFRLSLTYRGGHLGYQNGTMLEILNLYLPSVSHQVLAKSDLHFRRRCPFKIFMTALMATMAATLNIQMEQF